MPRKPKNPEAEVYQSQNGWAVKRSDKDRASWVKETKAEAVSAARALRHKGVDVWVFDKTGRLQEYLPSLKEIKK